MLHIISIFAAAEEAGGIGALGINIQSILASTVTFLLLYYVLKKFALTKIVGTLEDRRKTIERGLKLTHDMDKLKNEFDAKVEARLKDARKQADQIMSEAHTEAAQLIQAAETSAQAKAEVLLNEARNGIAREIEDARKSLRSEIANLVIAATEAVIDEKLDARKDAALIERSLNGVRK